MIEILEWLGLFVLLAGLAGFAFHRSEIRRNRKQDAEMRKEHHAD